MVARIKDKNPYASNIHKHKPRGVKDKEFERVYWPFLPVVFAATLLIGLSIHTGSMATYLKNPLGRVLSYETSQNSSDLMADTNYQREAVGSPDLSLNSRLSQAAQAKAQDMALRNYWSHNTPDGKEPWTFVSATGYQYSKLGENLATGFNDEQSVIKAWMASPPHRENLIDPSYTEVGFGFSNAPNYTAVGGGQMTIVVAYYGRPISEVALPPSTVITSSAPSSDNNVFAKTLAASTSRSQLAFSKTSPTNWGYIAILLSIGGLVVLIVRKHIKSIKISLKRSEKFIWRHPLVDLLVLLVIGLLFVMIQTAGYIQ